MKPNWSNKKVLIVEDVYFNHFLLRTILFDTLIQIFIARNSMEFFKLIKENTYDLILMDINLSEDLNGIDLIRYIQNIKIDVPVIIQTAYTDDFKIDNDIKYNAIIYKPIMTDILLNTIDEIFTSKNLVNQKN